MINFTMHAESVSEPLQRRPGRIASPALNPADVSLRADRLN
jgi:hypothetical protein